MSWHNLELSRNILETLLQFCPTRAFLWNQALEKYRDFLQTARNRRFIPVFPPVNLVPQQFVKIFIDPPVYQCLSIIPRSMWKPEVTCNQYEVLCIRICFRFQTPLFFSVFKNISVHTITHKRFENANSLLRLESYLPKHLYLLVKPQIFKVLFVFVSCQDVSNWPSRLGVKVTW